MKVCIGVNFDVVCVVGWGVIGCVFEKIWNGVELTFDFFDYFYRGDVDGFYCYSVELVW